jgi:hypothetical protein
MPKVIIKQTAPIPCDDANYELTVEGVVVGSGAIPSGDTQQIPIDEFIDCGCPSGTLTDEDGNYLLDEDGNCISGEGAVSCEPVTYVVKYEDETPIESGSVESGGSIEVIVPNCPTPEPCADATAVLKDSEGTVISSTDIPSGDSADITAPDGVVTITDTTPTTLHTVNVKSNGTASQSIADSVVNVNAVKLADVKATDTLNITVVDSLDASVSVTLSGGNKIIVDDLPCAGSSTPFDGAKILRTDQTTSYFTGDDGDVQRGRGDSWLALTYNNLFGHKRRFSGITGGYHNGSGYVDIDGVATTEALAFPDGWAIDWMTFDRDNDSYAMYQITPRASSTNYTDLLLEQPVTIGGYADVRYCNIQELIQISRMGVMLGTAILNYEPFNYTISGANATRVGSITNDGTNKQIINQVGGVTALAVNTGTVYWYIRRGTLTELGL